MLYPAIIRPLFFRLPPETAHRIGMGGLKLACRIPGVEAALRQQTRVPEAAVEAMGLRFPSPLGLAAGFDKNAHCFNELGALGFGFVEVGTITRHAQPGNETPRVFRLPDDQALINRLGFNNHGATRAAKNLAKERRAIVGINIGKTKRVALDDAIEDYVASTKTLASYADYLVVNVSSPNTPGLRKLQSEESLKPLLVAVREAAVRTVPARHIPLLVKIAPDLDETQLSSIGQLVLKEGLDGIIATNTTLSRSGLATKPQRIHAIGAGGLSGRPLRNRATEVLKGLRAVVGPNLTIVAAGGIMNGEDALERLKAGATLLQAYTGFIYGGPAFPLQVARVVGQQRIGKAVPATQSERNLRHA